MIRRIKGIIRKEFIHIFRDWRTLMIIILMPILMIVLYGYAITLDMRNIRFSVIDDAATPESRELIRGFSENGFFVLVPNPKPITRNDVEHLFRRRDVAMVLVIPNDFSKSMTMQQSTKIQILVDASDSNVGTFINNYSNQVFQLFNQRHNRRLPLNVRLEPRVFYNADMKSSYFFVPGLIALILLLISALLTSITITREKEMGTMEQILVSPIHPVEIIIGKVIPYISLGVFNGAMILISSRILFDVPVRGSLILLTGLSLVYIFVALSFGLLISTVAKTQQIAMLMTLMATILPTIIISGFIFPIASMPVALQAVSRVIPATYFLIIIRGIMLKGVGLPELWIHASALTGIGLAMLTLATRRFSVTLET